MELEIDCLISRILFQKASSYTNVSSAPKYVYLQGSGLSSLSGGWAKYKVKVSDVSDSNQNLETTCNSKLKFTELKYLIIKRM